MNKRQFEKEIQKYINFAEVRKLSKTLPWPYNGMVNDLLGSILSRGNYLSALGLITYSEICGRKLFFNGNEKKEGSKCFSEFLKFLGLSNLLNSYMVYKGKQMYFYQAIRHGLSHNYFLNVDNGAIAMIPSNKKQIRNGFLIEKSGRVVLIVIAYFNLFCRGLTKARDIKLI